MDANGITMNNDLTIRNYNLDDVDYVITGHHKMYEVEYGLNTNVWKSYVADAVHDFINEFDEKKTACTLLSITAYLQEVPQ